MTHSLLDEFGRRLVTQVRDKTISEWQMICNGRMKGEDAARLRLIIARLSDEPDEAFASLVPEVVDSVLHHLLQWFEEDDEHIRLSVDFGGKSVPNLAEESDGFAGELYSDRGWITRYSNATP